MLQPYSSIPTLFHNSDTPPGHVNVEGTICIPATQLFSLSVIENACCFESILSYCMFLMTLPFLKVKGDKCPVAQLGKTTPVQAILRIIVVMLYSSQLLHVYLQFIRNL